ncbi:hypothetical protein AAEX28_01915 [Lentisphaerota bacterium WC36G]|nr:HNH endonuclease [Lentisphaerae bacterium WC36]
MNLKKSSDFYLTNYETLVEYEFCKEKRGKNGKLNLDSKGILIEDPLIDGKIKCRFCGEEIIENENKNKAHAVPQCLGNKSIILLNECKNCNDKFAVYENDLGIFTKLYRSLLGIKGKKRIPTIKKEVEINGQNYESFRSDWINGMLEIRSTIDSKNFKIEKNEKFLTIKHYGEFYKPFNVAKAFIKMVLSVIPLNEFNDHKVLNFWLMNEEVNAYIKPLKIIKFFVPGPNPLGNGRIKILKRREKLGTNYPELVAVVSHKNYLYQISIFNYNPIDKKLDIMNCDLPLYHPNVTDEYTKMYGDFIFGKIDLTSPNKTELKDEIKFCYGEIHEVNTAKENDINYRTNLKPITHVPDIESLSATITLQKNGAKIKEYRNFMGSINMQELKGSFRHTTIPLIIHMEQNLQFLFNDELVKDLDLCDISMEFYEDLSKSDTLIIDSKSHNIELNPPQIKVSIDWNINSDILAFIMAIQLIQKIAEKVDLEIKYDDFRNWYTPLKLQDLSKVYEFIFYEQRKLGFMKDILTNNISCKMRDCISICNYIFDFQFTFLVTNTSLNYVEYCVEVPYYNLKYKINKQT